MKLYILTDIEGVAGVANFTDYSYGDGRFYPQSRHGIGGPHYLKLQLEFIRRTMGVQKKNGN